MCLEWVEGGRSLDFHLESLEWRDRGAGERERFGERSMILIKRRDAKAFLEYEADLTLCARSWGIIIKGEIADHYGVQCTIM